MSRSMLVRMALLLALSLLVRSEAAADEESQESQELKKKVAKFEYPGAQGHRGTGRVGKSLHYESVLATKDDLDKVLEWYGKQTGVSWKEVKAGATSFQQSGDTRSLLQDDSMQLPLGPQKARPVVIRILTQDAKDYYLSVVISRGQGESHTHVALTYFPK